VAPGAATVPGYMSIPHTTQGKYLVGGPSNAGGLFLNWARRVAGAGDGDALTGQCLTEHS